MLLPALLRQLRRELTLAAAPGGLATQPGLLCCCSGGGGGGGAGGRRQLTTSAALALRAAAAAAAPAPAGAAAASAAVASAPPPFAAAYRQQQALGGAPRPGAAPAWPPPPPPPPDHLQSRRRGFRPPAPGLGRRAPRSSLARYPFEVDYYSPKPVFLYDLEGRPLARRELPGDVFNVPVRLDILHRVVRWQRAKAQQGTHKAKDRSEVSGGGKKPWRQKGTGQARQGSIRAPQWRGGGAAHGPVPRSHAHKLPKKVRRLGLKCALSAKAHEGRLLLLDSLRPDTPKTKLLAARLARLLAGRGPRRSALLIDSAKDGADGGGALRRAGRNLGGIEIVPACGANVYSILRRDVLLMTAAAADALVARLRAPINRLGAAGRARGAAPRGAAAAEGGGGAAAGGGAAEGSAAGGRQQA
ncbi:MAG: ribosomal protein L4 domain-containing protein [Monoraphidium minutum]|nr:MAG: ribosomal protein L4 domain-containing protein [Monoraphidium minutum]